MSRSVIFHGIACCVALLCLRNISYQKFAQIEYYIIITSGKIIQLSVLKFSSSFKENRIFHGFVANVQGYIVVILTFSATFANFGQFIKIASLRLGVFGIFGFRGTVHQPKGHKTQ